MNCRILATARLFFNTSLQSDTLFSLENISVAVDGAMLASRDFGFMLLQGTLSLLVQWKLLTSSWCSTVSAVFATFTFRLGSYALLGLIRVALGYGPLGKALRRNKEEDGNDNFNGENQGRITGANPVPS